MKVLRRTQFGNPILRSQTRILTQEEILSEEIQQLIRNMCHTLEQKSAGIGLAATQVGESVAVAVIGIKPTPSRPNLKRQELIMINPVVIKTYGHRTGMWEACISGTDLYAMALRYKKVRLRYQDEDAKEHERDFEGLMAHVIQHEVDHLNGILFVDRVKDTSTYMTGHEYRKMKKHEGITPKT